jgi:dTDP-4-dehydrorhamnose reductase
MLGRAWRNLLFAEDIQFYAPASSEIDFTRQQTLAQIDDRYSIVINAAAYTDVDQCETDQALARQVNTDGPVELARRCAEWKIKLLHYSSDYVFSGRADVPYATAALRQPLSVYGRTKADAEAGIESSGCDYFIIRASWLYAPWGKNFVRTIFGLAQERDFLRVVSDQRGRPTCCEHLARTSLELFTRGATGIYHVADGGDCSWFDLACHVVRESGLRCKVQPCTTAEYSRPAPRPNYSVLDLTKTEQLLGHMPHWAPKVAAVVNQLMECAA